MKLKLRRLLEVGRLLKSVLRDVIIVVSLLFVGNIIRFFGIGKSIVFVWGITLYQIILLWASFLVLVVISMMWKKFHPIIDTGVENFFSNLPGFKKVEKKTVKRILYDLAYIIIAILVFSAIQTFLSAISIRFLEFVSGIFALILIFLFLYDLSKNFYKIFSRKFESK